MTSPPSPRASAGTSLADAGRPDGMGAAIVARDLSVVCGRLRLLDQVSLAVPSGVLGVVVGTNGSGTSALLAILAGVLAPTSGEVRIAGERVDTKRRWRRRPQRLVGYADRWHPSSSVEEVGEHLLAVAGAHGIDRRQRRTTVDGALELTGSTSFARTRLGALTPASLARVRLARALVHDPVVVLADDPWAGLDEGTIAELRGLLADLVSLGKTALIATHDPAELRPPASWAAVLHAGVLLEASDPGPPNRVASTASEQCVVEGPTLPLTKERVATLLEATQ